MNKVKKVYLSLPIKDTGFTTKQRIEYANEIRRLLNCAMMQAMRT